MNLSPCVSLTFNGACEEAFHFYERLMGGKIELSMRWKDSPMAQQAPANWGDKLLYARITIGDAIIAAGDVPPESYVQPSGFQLTLSIASRAEGQKLFAALAEEGHIRFPLQETFWSGGYGQVTDRFGIPWEINCEKDH